MVDREKVINELVEHIESALSLDSDYVDCVQTDLLQTVVGLLKAQEPRVMALEEMKAIPYDADIWIETEYYVGKITIFAATINTKGLRGVMVYGSHKTYNYEGYNKLWRCWISRPTDEQRKATPWEK